MLNDDERAVMVALQEYEERVTEIMDFLAEKKAINVSEREWLQSLIIPLKADIKAAAKRGKVSDDRLPQTSAESSYFSGVMWQVSANFSVATNSHPIRANWFVCLYDIQADIRHVLYQLKEKA